MSNHLRTLVVMTIGNLIALACLAGEGKPVENMLMPVAKGNWSIVVLPDTQNYSKSDRNMEVLNWTMDWIRGQARNRNIKALLQVGDIVNNNNKPQWKRMQAAAQRLGDSMPYFFAQGNHDMGIGGSALTRDSDYNKYFDPKTSPLNARYLLRSFEPNRFENALYKVPVGGRDYLFLLLEFGPRNAVLDWANDIAREYKKNQIFVITHEYMDESSRLLSTNGEPTPSTRSTYGNAHHYALKARSGRIWERSSKNCGQEIWDKFLSKHGNISHVFSGHYGDYVEPYRGVLEEGKGMAKAYRFDRVSNAAGMLHQFMVDSQWIPSGGDGWLLFIELDKNGQMLKAQTYSPWVENFPVRNTAPEVFSELWFCGFLGCNG